jgi:hypothetical protein
MKIYKCKISREGDIDTVLMAIGAKKLLDRADKAWAKGRSHKAYIRTLDEELKKYGLTDENIFYYFDEERDINEYFEENDEFKILEYHEYKGAI